MNIYLHAAVKQLENNLFHSPLWIKNLIHDACRALQIGGRIYSIFIVICET